MAGWGQVRPGWINSHDELESLLWEALREGSPSAGEDVPLPSDRPWFADRDLYVTAAHLDLGDALRPALTLSIPHQYKTRVRATSSGVTWDGEHDRLDPDDMAAVEEWITPHLVRVDAAADVIRRFGWLDPHELGVLVGGSRIFT